MSVRLSVGQAPHESRSEYASAPRRQRGSQVMLLREERESGLISRRLPQAAVRLSTVQEDERYASSSHTVYRFTGRCETYSPWCVQLWSARRLAACYLHAGVAIGRRRSGADNTSRRPHTVGGGQTSKKLLQCVPGKLTASRHVHHGPWSTKRVLTRTLEHKAVATLPNRSPGRSVRRAGRHSDVHPPGPR